MPASLTAGIKLYNNILSNKRYKFSQSLIPALSMGCEGPSARRPFCLNCNKPARLCLCSRFRSPPIDNAVGITILQHSLEKNHPVNSTRVAKLGIKNLNVVTVTDINFHSWFLIRLTGRSDEIGMECCDSLICDGSEKKLGKINNYDCFSHELVTGTNNVEGLEVSNSVEGSHLSLSESKIMNSNVRGDCRIDTDDVVIPVMEKYKVVYSSDYVNIFFECNAKPNIRWIGDTLIGKRIISDGFFIKKLQRKQVRLTKEFEDFEEFDILVPPGTALLFPSENALCLKEVDFEVKHLIVLDGTWSKAKRMYHENPWLQLLPHLKLDSGKKSLYSGVRTQPKEGYLSTIESIVCALDELGEDKEGLQDLLEVFDSMIMDQKQCKADKFKAMPSN